MILLFTATVAGFFLGLHFRVLILAPAIALDIAGTVASLGHHHSILIIVWSMFGTLILLQLSYMVGSALQTYAPVQFGALIRRDNWLPSRY